LIGLCFGPSLPPCGTNLSAVKMMIFNWKEGQTILSQNLPVICPCHQLSPKSLRPSVILPLVTPLICSPTLHLIPL
jgi:hypothetical protein